VTEWHVVVHNDSVNTISVVVDVLNRVVGLPLDDAVAGMRRIHEQGSAAISSTSRDAVETMVARLHGYGLDASVGRAAS
jgi:ATP-dependent Clp protease adaptor protein ClpS